VGHRETAHGDRRVTVSIRKVLAALPTGAQGVDLSWQEVGRYLAEQCNRDADKAREKRHVLRDEFYCDGGVDYIKSVIDDVFQDEEVRALRKKWVPHARFNNAIKRIVNEVSTVYSAPATRQVTDGDDVYQDVLERLQFDVVMQQVNRLFNLHRIVLVAPRVRQIEDGTREPVIDVATPATFRVVLHPNDNTRPIGWILRLNLRSFRRGDTRQAAWVLWTDHEWIHLDENMSPIEATLNEHGIGVCPWLPIMRSPVRPGFWPGDEGEDLVAAQVAIWMSNVLLLKETKSATKQTILSGDLAGVARGQSADSEVPNQIADGVAVNTVDMSMDLAMFRDTGDHALERAANNYGMSLAAIKHQGTQSAEARDMMRIPLRELRREQHPAFRMFERGLARRMGLVFAKDAPDLAFSADGWRIDFGEAQTPLTPSEELVLFEKERAAGLDCTPAFLMRRNPDLDEDAARTVILANIEAETWRVRNMRELQAVAGAISNPATPPSEPNDQPDGQAA
jgi:hypothetical protein